MNFHINKLNTKTTPKYTVYHIINSTLRKEKEIISLTQENTALQQTNEKLKSHIELLQNKIKQLTNDDKY